jgi:hypothetical protein
MDEKNIESNKLIKELFQKGHISPSIYFEGYHEFIGPMIFESTIFNKEIVSVTNSKVKFKKIEHPIHSDYADNCSEEGFD